MRACKELGYKELPCKILAPDTPVKKLREYATKDNVNFGENDLDVMENEWNKAELQDWGIEFAPEKMCIRDSCRMMSGWRFTKA